MDKIDDIDAQDKRLNAITRLAEDWVSPWTGQKAKKGALLHVVATCNYEKLDMTIPMPSAPAMFIHAAKKMYSEAINILIKIIGKHDYTKKGAMNISGQDGRMIDYFELMAGSYIFAITALESFVNEKIPDDYTYTKLRGNKQCTESYSKDQIERYLSLDEKISAILPSLLGVKTPKGKKVYHNYIKVREIRDRIIHMKSKDRKSGEKKTIWNDLLSKRHTNPVSSSLELIKYFYSTDKFPRWLQNI